MVRFLVANERTLLGLHMNQSQTQTQLVYTNDHTMDREQIRLRHTTRIRPSIVALFAEPVFMVLLLQPNIWRQRAQEGLQALQP